VLVRPSQKIWWSKIRAASAFVVTAALLFAFPPALPTVVQASSFPAEKAIFANNIVSKIAMSITDVQTSIVLNPGTGAAFPSPSSTTGTFFAATLYDSTNTNEIVYVTARTADTLTVIRAREGTTARSWSVGSAIAVRLTADIIQDKLQNPPYGRVYYVNPYATSQVAVGVAGALDDYSLADINEYLASEGTPADVIVPAKTTSYSIANTITINDETNLIFQAGAVLDVAAGQFILFPDGSVVIAEWFESLSDATLALGATQNIELILRRSQSLDTPVTIPTGVTYSAISGAIVTTSAVNTFTAPAGSRLVFNGTQMFDASPGEMVVGIGTIDSISPAMFGTIDDLSLYIAITAVAGSDIPVRVPAGEYDWNEARTVTTSVKILGDGGDKTVFTATAAVDMLTFAGAAPLNDIRLEGFKLDGDHVATGGVKIVSANKVHTDQFYSNNMIGYGLWLEGVWDSEFRNLMLMHDGQWVTDRTDGVPPLYIGPDAVSGRNSNSIRFTGHSVIERFYYHGAVIEDSPAVHFIGTKIHGRTHSDSQSVDPDDIAEAQAHGNTTPGDPDPADLIHNLGSKRMVVANCQLVEALRNGIYLADSASASTPNATIADNVFQDVHSYEGATSASFILFNTGTGTVVGNDFFLVTTLGDVDADESWSVRGSCIRLASGAGNVIVPDNSNYYPASAVRGLYDLRSAHDVSEEKQLYGTGTANTIFSLFLNEVKRFGMLLNGTLKWYDAAGAADVELSRDGANSLALAAGDQFKSDVVNLRVLTAEPASPANGMMAYADGATWNPGGTGAGFYVYEAGAWAKK